MIRNESKVFQQVETLWKHGKQSKMVKNEMLNELQAIMSMETGRLALITLERETEEILALDLSLEDDNVALFHRINEICRAAVKENVRIEHTAGLCIEKIKMVLE